MANTNDTNRLIDMIYERIEEAKAPALKPNMSIVERNEILDLLDELRAQLPVELRRAHQKNDEAVMRAYGFWGSVKTESDCVARLMEMYAGMTK